MNSGNARSRRRFIGEMALVAGTICVGSKVAGAAEDKQMYLATNQYPWGTFYAREGRNFGQSLDEALGEIASSGMNGYEPLVNSAAEVEQLAPLLRKQKLEMRSLYVNTTLHVPDEAAKSFDHVLGIANKAKEVGTRIIVTNPNPIRWGGPENKTDAMLKTQAESLNELGQKLAAIGMVLSYHNHDAELRNAAREFHHMMCGTDPKLVTLCLDSHWIYRGSGNSAVALFDVLKLYGSRITELHLRQSVKGVWTEAFGEGDIDYPALAKYLRGIGIKPHLVMEQAVEAGSDKTMNAVEAHRKSGQYARRVFAEMGA